MRAILYARVSTRGQAEKGYSLRQQMEALEQYAASCGYEVVGQFSDDGYGGTTLDRPGLEGVRQLVEAGNVDLVLAQDQDRFSREPAHQFYLEKDFQRYGCKLRAMNDADDTPEGDLLRGIRAQVSKYERVQITERTRRGKLRRAREGKIVPAGSPPMGWSYDGDTYIPNDTLPLARQIIELAAQGNSLHSIRKHFESLGIRTVGNPRVPEGSKYWNINTIRRTIKNDLYRPHTVEEIEPLVLPSVASTLDPEASYGIDWYNRRTTSTDHNGKRSRGELKPQDQWIAVPVKLPPDWLTAAEVDKARGSLQGFKESRANSRFWELSGHVECACGVKLVSRVTRRVLPSTGESKAYHYYVCSRYTRNGRGDCQHGKWLNADRLEMQVYEALRSIQPQDVESQIDDLIANERPSEAHIAGWQQQLQDVEHRRTKYQEMFVAGVMDMPTLQSRTQELDDRERAIRSELESLHTTDERVERLKWLRTRMAENPVLAFLAETPDMRRNYYRDLELKVTCAGTDTTLTGVFGSQSVAPTSTSATRR